MADRDLRAAWMPELAEVSPDMLVLLEVDGTITAVNPAWADQLGLTGDALLGRHYLSFVHPEDRERTRDVCASLLDGRSVHSFENRWHAANRRWRWISWSARLVPEADRILGSGRDVTDRMEKLVRVTHDAALLERAERVAGIGVWEWNPDLDVAYISDALRDTFGVDREEPFTYAHLLALVHPEDTEALKTAVESARQRGGTFACEYRVVRPDGTERSVVEFGESIVEDGRTVRMFGTVQDVTEQRALEAGLRAAHRMESVGRLAGGIAHDVNNLLMGILGYAEEALGDLGDRARVQTALTEIGAAVHRGAALTRQVLTFSRQQPRSDGVVDVNAAIAVVHGLIDHVIGQDVRIGIDLADEPLPVPLAQSDLEQVLMNLCVNARDAMPDGGTILIATRRTGARVRISVRDAGVGMDAETAARASEPFFTTKGEGQGTGLGLSTVYGIVASAGGDLRIRSIPGMGTTVQVDLPAVAAPQAAPQTGLAPPPSGSERVIVVDDDPMVRQVVSRALSALGYEVHAAADAATALDLAERHPIDLLVSDVMMPGMRGTDLVEAMTARHPAVRAVLMSGYPSRPGEQPEACTYLMKPFGIAELAQHVRAALDGTAVPDDEG